MNYDFLPVAIINKSKHQDPTYGSDEAAGMDLRADLDKDLISVTIEPGESVTIPTNIHFGIPKGYEGQIRGRSGLAFKNHVFAYFGTIDSDYQGAVGILLTNSGKHPFVVSDGMRVAQIVFAKQERATLVPKTSFDRETERGINGFGSTGLVDDTPNISVAGPDSHIYTFSAEIPHFTNGFFNMFSDELEAKEALDVFGSTGLVDDTPNPIMTDPYLYTFSSGIPHFSDELLEEAKEALDVFGETEECLNLLTQEPTGTILTEEDMLTIEKYCDETCLYKKRVINLITEHGESTTLTITNSELISRYKEFVNCGYTIYI